MNYFENLQNSSLFFGFLKILTLIQILCKYFAQRPEKYGFRKKKIPLIGDKTLLLKRLEIFFQKYFLLKLKRLLQPKFYILQMPPMSVFQKKKIQPFKTKHMSCKQAVERRVRDVGRVTLLYTAVSNFILRLEILFNVFFFNLLRLNTNINNGPKKQLLEAAQMHSVKKAKGQLKSHNSLMKLVP